MLLFSEETRSRFAKLTDDFDAIDAFYEWNTRMIPSSIKPTRRRPDRLLGHNGTIYAYRMLVRSRDAVHAFAVAFERPNAVMCALAARAHAETTGYVAYFLKKLRLLYAGHLSYDELHEILRQLTLGSMSLPGKAEMLPEVSVPDPIKVMSCIDAVDDLLKPRLTEAKKQGVVPKDWTPFRDAYDVLSELCHPNFAGTTLGAGIVTENDWPVVRFTQRPAMALRDAKLITSHFVHGPELLQEFMQEVLRLLKENEQGPLIFRTE